MPQGEPPLFTSNPAEKSGHQTRSRSTVPGNVSAIPAVAVLSVQAMVAPKSLMQSKSSTSKKKKSPASATTVAPKSPNAVEVLYLQEEEEDQRRQHCHGVVPCLPHYRTKVPNAVEDLREEQGLHNHFHEHRTASLSAKVSVCGVETGADSMLSKSVEGCKSSSSSCGCCS